MKNIKKATVWADSILKGVIYDENTKKYRICKENGMNQLSIETGIMIDNNAKFGLTAPKALRLLKETLKDQNPTSDVCIIELGGNDSDYNWSEISINPDLKYSPNTKIDDFKTAIRNMIIELREKNIEPVLLNLPPIDPDRYFDWISRGLNKDNILRWLGTKNRIYTHHEAYSIAIMDVANDMQCNVVNVREAFLNEGVYSKYLCIDGIHLNQEGQGIIKKVFENFITKKKINFN